MENKINSLHKLNSLITEHGYHRNMLENSNNTSEQQKWSETTFNEINKAIDSWYEENSQNFSHQFTDDLDILNKDKDGAARAKRIVDKEIERLEVQLNEKTKNIVPIISGASNKVYPIIGHEGISTDELCFDTQNNHFQKLSNNKSSQDTPASLKIYLKPEAIEKLKDLLKKSNISNISDMTANSSQKPETPDNIAEKLVSLQTPEFTIDKKRAARR